MEEKFVVCIFMRETVLSCFGFLESVFLLGIGVLNCIIDNREAVVMVNNRINFVQSLIKFLFTFS